MQFKNVFKSSKAALIKGKYIFALSEITLCLVTLSSEQSRCNRKQTLSQSIYEKKSIWFHLSIKCLTKMEMDHVAKFVFETLDW